MSRLAQLRPLAFSLTDTRAGRSRAETYGVVASGLAATAAAALIFAPLSGLPSANPVQPLGTQSGAMSVFLAAAPFDALRRSQTSIGPLDAPVTLPPADPFVISGIIINGNERKVMLSGAPGVWRSEGQEADGWLVRHIEPEQIILTRGADIKTSTYRAALETMGQNATAASSARPSAAVSNPERPDLVRPRG